MKKSSEIVGKSSEVKIIDPFELFQATNPALARINDFKASIGIIDARFDEAFYKNLDKIVDRVRDHFNRRER